MLQDVERLSGNINSILNLARIESRVYEGRAHTGRSAGDDPAVHRRQPPSLPQLRHPRGKRLPDETSHLSRHRFPVRDAPDEYPDQCHEIQHLRASPGLTSPSKRREHHLLIHFRDNGIGIAKEERKRIFRKFYRGHGNDLVPVGGSGIGLYLVQQIARLHHGKMVADSEGVGKGSVSHADPA